MKLPKTFVPEKDLENNTERLLSGEILKLERSLVLFDKLEIESESYQEHYHFCTSMKRLKEKGYYRHLRPWESFDIITKYLEKNLPPDLESFAKDMLSCQGEWFSMAVQREGDELFCFADPENIDQNRNGWSFFFDGSPKYNYAMSDILPLNGIPSGTWVPLDQFDDKFVKYFYNRELKDLPKEFIRGPNRAQVYIPPEGHVWPTCRGTGVNMLYLCSGCSCASSRGIKRRNTG